MDKLTKDINTNSLSEKDYQENKALMIDILDTMKVKYAMKDEDIAMAAINLIIGKKPFFIEDDESWIHKQNNPERERYGRKSQNKSRGLSRRSGNQNNSFETFRFDYGRANRIRIPNIISSICTATNINGRSIGKIQVFNDFSLVDLPKNLSKETIMKLKHLKIKSN
tara:strand:- start:85 stop:585 length:501 start_codon:yes stop_codon:yes gene_type:complete